LGIKTVSFIEVHFQIVKDMPDEIYLLISTCPARLNDPSDICAKNIRDFRRWLMSYLTRCLAKGINSGEFAKVPVKPTANLLLAMINGLVRQRVLNLNRLKNMKKTAVDFCRRSLINGNMSG
jgi:hypothetical protein